MQKHYVIIAAENPKCYGTIGATYIQQYVGANKITAERHLSLYKDTPLADTTYWLSDFYNYDGKTLSQNMREQCTDGKKPSYAKNYNIRMNGIDSNT